MMMMDFSPDSDHSGLSQGGEFVTARATAAARGAYRHYTTDPRIAHPTNREAEEFEI